MQSYGNHISYEQPPCLQLEGTTQFDYEEFIFRWKLKIPYLKQSLLNTFDSPIFIGGEKSQHSWQLRWKRSLSSERNNAYYYHVELTLVATGDEVQDRNWSFSPGKKIQAYADVSFKELNDTEMLNIQAEAGNSNVIFRDVEAGQQVESVSIHESEFFDESKGYILNNVVTVYCRIIVSCGSKNSSVSKIVFPDSSANSESLKMTPAVKFLNGALHSTDFVDVQLVTGTKVFPAHKVILAARSPVFSAMFRCQMQESKENSVDIQDFDEGVVEAMLEFIYTGNISKFTQETDYLNVSELLRISDKYELLELKAQCDNFFCSKINVQNSVEMLELACLYCCRTLKTAAVQFIMRNKNKVCRTDSFKKLRDPSVLMELLLLTGN